MGKRDGNASAQIDICGAASPVTVWPIVAGAGDKLQITLSSFRQLLGSSESSGRGIGAPNYDYSIVLWRSYKPLRWRLCLVS